MSDELIEFTCTERLVLANFTPDWLRRGIIMPDPDLRRPDGLHLTRYHEEHSDEDDTGLSIADIDRQYEQSREAHDDH